MRDNLLKWIGGKHQLGEFIITKMCEHKGYVEAFAGALHIFFQKEIAPDFNIVNDVNDNLINLYKCIQDDIMREAVIRECKLLFYSRTMFREMIAKYNSSYFSYLRAPLRAAIFLYVNRASFNGMFQSFAHREDSTFRPDQIAEVSEMMARKMHAGKTVIENMDVMELLTKYDRKGTLFYLDPPYWVTTESKGKDYYEYVMSKQQHEDLMIQLLSKTLYANWLMSYDDHPEVRKLYKPNNQNLFMISTPPTNQSSANSSVKDGKEAIYKTELLIANYDIRNQNTLWEGTDTEMYK